MAFSMKAGMEWSDSRVIFLKKYFDVFEELSRGERWDEIVYYGELALGEARELERWEDEARISAQLTSTTFYQGDYVKALVYAKRCHELSEKFEDKGLFLRALYLESAVHRALAGKGEESFEKAVEIGDEAARLYGEYGIENDFLKGKIYFNLGAAFADDPKGDLDRASRNYEIAIGSYEKANSSEDLIRTRIRLGKVFLLKGNFAECGKVIEEARSSKTNERISMQIDYLEAQYLVALNDLEKGKEVAKVGIQKARNLGAKEDEQRFMKVMELV